MCFGVIHLMAVSVGGLFWLLVVEIQVFDVVYRVSVLCLYFMKLLFLFVFLHDATGSIHLYAVCIICFIIRISFVFISHFLEKIIYFQFSLSLKYLHVYRNEYDLFSLVMKSF